MHAFVSTSLEPNNLCNILVTMESVFWKLSPTKFTGMTHNRTRQQHRLEQSRISQPTTNKFRQALHACIYPLAEHLTFRPTQRSSVTRGTKGMVDVLPEGRRVTQHCATPRSELDEKHGRRCVRLSCYGRAPLDVEGMTSFIDKYRAHLGVLLAHFGT